MWTSSSSYLQPECYFRIRDNIQVILADPKGRFSFSCSFRGKLAKIIGWPMWGPPLRNSGSATELFVLFLAKIQLDLRNISSRRKWRYRNQQHCLSGFIFFPFTPDYLSLLLINIFRYYEETVMAWNTASPFRVLFKGEREKIIKEVYDLKSVRIYRHSWSRSQTRKLR